MIEVATLVLYTRQAVFWSATIERLYVYPHVLRCFVISCYTLEYSVGGIYLDLHISSENRRILEFQY